MPARHSCSQAGLVQLGSGWEGCMGQGRQAFSRGGPHLALKHHSRYGTRVGQLQAGHWGRNAKEQPPVRSTDAQLAQPARMRGCLCGCV